MMRRILKPLILTLFLTSFYWIHGQQNQVLKPIKPDIGILDIYDNHTRLNYNQAFYHFLAENSILKNNKTATISLVEHFSNAEISLNAIIEENSILFTIYKQESLFSRDTLYIPTLETKASLWGPLFNVKKTAYGYEVYNVNKAIYSKQSFSDGIIIKQIDGTLLDNLDSVSVANLLYSDLNTSLDIKGWDPIQSSTRSFKLLRFADDNKVWSKPLSNIELGTIFKTLLNKVASNPPTTGFKFPLEENVKSRSITKFTPKHSSKRVKSQEQIATFSSKTHPIALIYPIDSTLEKVVKYFFEKEEFAYQFRIDKNSKAGDAALFNLLYYNYDQNISALINNSNVSNSLKEAVISFSGPYYNKPGVLVNYFLAAATYQTVGNYEAALNQYYASLRKIDDLICSELSKVKIKIHILDNIAHCCEHLNQNNYAKMIRLASSCLAEIENEKDLIALDSNFYAVSNQLSIVCKDIESQLAEQKLSKILSYTNAAMNVAGGVAAYNLDAGVSVGFFTNALIEIGSNIEYNEQVNSTLSRVSQSLDINLPPELQEEYQNPYEILASYYINYALIQSTHKAVLFDKMKVFASDFPELEQIIETEAHFFNTQDKFDYDILIRALLKTEIMLYRYEKRGMSPSNIVKT